MNQAEKVTNRAGPTTIFDLSKLIYEGTDAPPDGTGAIHHVLDDNNSVGVRKALVHQQDEVHIHIYVLDPGGCIKSHLHTKNWDIFHVIEGEFEAVHNKHEAPVRCGKQTMHFVPPGVIHEIVNPSATESLKFLLIQSPSKGYDFIRTALPV